MIGLMGKCGVGVVHPLTEPQFTECEECLLMCAGYREAMQGGIAAVQKKLRCGGYSGGIGGVKNREGAQHHHESYAPQSQVVHCCITSPNTAGDRWPDALELDPSYKIKMIRR